MFVTYLKKVLRAAFEYGFKHLKYKEVYVMRGAKNIASIRILEKTGVNLELIPWHSFWA
jgi:RimJ/RimL family protein N-acetyltransferase